MRMMAVLVLLWRDAGFHLMKSTGMEQLYRLPITTVLMLGIFLLVIIQCVSEIRNVVKLIWKFTSRGVLIQILLKKQAIF